MTLGAPDGLDIVAIHRKDVVDETRLFRRRQPTFLDSQRTGLSMMGGVQH